MLKLRHFAGAIPFLVAVFLNAFVDLGHKIIIQNTVFKLYDGPLQVILIAVVNGLILLPFILLLSPAGFLSDKYRKTSIMQASAWAAVAITLGITACYYMGWFWAAFAMTFLLAAQSAVYSPAKYGYIRELFGKEHLGEANGLVSALSICAILVGIFAFSILFELWYPAGSLSEADILRAIAPIGWLLVLNSVIELVMMYRLPTQPATGVTTTFETKKYLSGRLFGKDLQPLVRSKVIRLSVIGLATFWGVGQVMLAAFPAFAKEEMFLTNTIFVQGILACSGVGIALGSVFAGRFSRDYIETGLLPLGALGIAMGLLYLPFTETLMAAALTFLFIGFMGGIFIVPLNALIQFHADESEMGRTLAANNWVQTVVMLSFLLLTVAFSLLGLSSKALLELIAIVALVGCFYTIYQLPQSLTRCVLSWVMSRRYKVAVQGLEHMPAQGGVLLLGNHISWVDWAIVQLVSPRPVRFVMLRSIYERWYLTWLFDLFGCIPIEQGVSSRNALKTVSDALNKGEVVCLFPEGTISRTGHLGDFRRGYERACIDVTSDVVILPFYLRGLWGSQFSRSSSHLKNNSLRLTRRDLIVAFGAPLPATTTADVLKRRVFDLSISSWEAYVETLPTVSKAWIHSAKRTGRRLAIADVVSGRDLSGYQALTGSIVLARRIKRHSPEQNLGLLLPSSAGGMLANMAALLRGKTLVNLNYTASLAALEAAVTQADIRTLYTSRRFMKKLEGRGIHLETLLNRLKVVYLEDAFEKVSLVEKLLTLVSVTVLPAWLLCWLHSRAHNSDATAAILFSSGSEGAPKGVCLSHKNIMANVKQTAEVLNTEEQDIVMANLPLFHAFGLTITQFMPLIESVPVVCHPDPTDVVASAQAIARYQATILFGTSTFLRLYNRNSKIHPLMLSSLRLVVAGAEKLNEDVRNSFTLKFSKPLYEGYGATETTPVASVNLPDKIESERWQVQRGQKPGSVGMPLPGTSCRVVDPETFEELPTGEAGMILIGGVQVMQGYLNNPDKTDSVIKNIKGTRWYVTGDKGYIDSDGFLFIVDRYSRFAKIAGEMISLAQTEQAISHLLEDPDVEVIVVAVSDAKKGEKLVALHDVELDTDSLKQALIKSGLNNLAIPDQWCRVAALPKLGSGKTDFGAAKALALECGR
ncbi:acyl-[ACP]--phospholipid O-acyltransferase [Nitrincola alkalisediminis]|uniref:acyl-[ACP]--phospholipid O-acyltransferase n=1 Tax=Nitrincola alkalisediminis TaxID=1366656 RepID=UPI001875844F|nr:acyl-[ACP]--phospholipid O-acyltransferase [Nitrincola alkalisediminis]